MTVATIILLLFTHFVADFVFQTDKQAKQKSTSNKWLSYHVASYSLGLLAFGLLWIGFGWNVWLWVVLNAVLHWCTDWVTSRINSKLWKDQKVHWFFVSIGFDQFIHYTTLILTYKLLIG